MKSVGFVGSVGGLGTRRSGGVAVERWAGKRWAVADAGRARLRMAVEESEANVVFPGALPVSTTWEIDFYSRPVLGLDGKKRWELIITDKSGNFEHVEEVPNSMVNSKELRKRIENVIAESSVKPKTLRFFRAQMQNMIKIALSGIDDIVVLPSRRTYSLLQVIEDREKNVYPKMVGYQASTADPFSLTNRGFDEVKIAEKMPDTLRGDKYAFVTLNVEQIRELGADDIGFGEICPIPDELSGDVVVPGVCIYSARSDALAGWLSGSEIASFSAVVNQNELHLESGLNTNYLFARISQQQRTEAKAFEKQKEESAGLHFLAVQKSPESETVAGFWLLRRL